MYDYSARILNVVDGDTIDVDLDLGCDIHLFTRIRLANVNAPELHSADPIERERAQAAKTFLSGLLTRDRVVRIMTEKDRTEKYGRYLGSVYLNWSSPDANNPSVNDQLVSAGHATPYTGGKR